MKKVWNWIKNYYKTWWEIEKLMWQICIELVKEYKRTRKMRKVGC